MFSNIGHMFSSLGENPNDNRNQRVETLGMHEVLRREKNYDAESLNNSGICFLREGEYKKAYEDFERAYRLCSCEYIHRSAFKNNMKLSQAEILNCEGDALFKLKKFPKALKKYESAVDRCPSDKTARMNKFHNNISKARNAWADVINNEGLKLLVKQDFHDAAQQFQLAFKKCDDSYTNKKTFKDNLLEAEAEILNAKGDKLVKKKKFSEAIGKYKMAYEICPRDRTVTIDKINQNFATTSASM